MRKIIFRLGVILLSATLFSSCEKWIDTDINTDPDRLEVVPMEVLLPSIQVQMAYLIGGNDAVRPTNIWMQYFDGVDRQSLTTATYIMAPSDPNNFWNNMYAGAMKDIEVLVKSADAKGSPVYRGVAKVCMASCLGEMTNLFGAIPYSDALNGVVLTPKYDKQSTVYNTIRTLLTEAQADLDAKSVIALSGDLIYGNDISLWKKAAKALLARTELNLSKVKGASAYTSALANIAGSFTSVNDDMLLGFGDSESNANPIYQFMVQRGDVVMCKTFTDLLNTSSDPRLPFYVTKGSAKDYNGSDPGSQKSGAALPGKYNADINSPVFFMSYAELRFIEAEAKYQTGDKDGALVAYKAAVAASVLKVTGNANATWLDANINNETAATLTLATIFKQKYLALYSQNQPFTDYRRTGLPNILKAPQGAVGAMPHRFPYPQNEMTYNTKNVPAKGDLKGTMWIDGGEDVGGI